MWSLQTDEYKLHSGARLQAGKRQAKTKEQFVAQVGGWQAAGTADTSRWSALTTLVPNDAVHS